MTSAFWDWSLSVYGREGLEPLLIKLQDDCGLDVNLILWCAWAGGRGVVLPGLSIRKAHDLSAKWADGVTGPLRAARRALKTPPRQISADDAVALRGNVKAAELEAERLQQGMLEALVEDIAPAEGVEPAAAARRNLAEYASLSGATRRPGFSTTDLQKALDLIYPD